MRPILAYGCPVWGYAAKTNINILDTLQNSTIRMIVFEITTTSHPKDLTVVMHGIPYVVEDSWHVRYPSVSFRTSLTSSSDHICKGRVIWNSPVPVTSLVQLLSSVPNTIRSFTRDQHIDKFFV
ncbi:hypothetical protein TNCV_2673951 [Trichonephila clavipes]|nr:hypothetical protein TNCV_2673951 [Trichonephila clavipes]